MNDRASISSSSNLLRTLFKSEPLEIDFFSGKRKGDMVMPTMLKTRAQIISFHCVTKNMLGQVLSSSFNQDVLNQKCARNDRLTGLVEGLQSVRAGEKRKIMVPANSAYGNYDPRLVIELKRSELKYEKQLQLGSQILRFHEPTSEDRVFRVIRINRGSVVLDANHPLAGHDLVFEVEIVSARDAQESDLLESSALMPGQLLH